RVVRDPARLRRPRYTDLSLVAHGELHGPAAPRGHYPDVVAPAHIADESHLLVVRGPGTVAHGARHVELFHGQRLAVELLFGRNLGGVGDESRSGSDPALAISAQ